MSMDSHIIIAEVERQKRFSMEERKAKRTPTTIEDGKMQLKWNIHKRLKREEFYHDEPNDDYVESGPTFLKNRGKGILDSDKYAQNGFNVNTTSLKPQYEENISISLEIPCRIKSRSPPKSFSFLMCRLSDDQKAAIREMGFESMLDFKIDKFPTIMGYWAVKNFDHKACRLLVRDASLKITNKTIHNVLGVPTGGMKISEFNFVCNMNRATQEFRNQFPATKKRIHVTDVVGEMVKQEKGGRLFKLNFLVLFVTVMAEGHSGVVNRKFLRCIRKLEDVRNMDWCQYILECLVRTRKEWSPKGYYNGPLAFLVVFYAHSINRKNMGKETLVPIIKMWTSEMLMILEGEEFNTGCIEEPATQKLIVIESDESDNDEDRKTSLRRKHDTIESCNTQVFEDANNKEAPENVYDVENVPFHFDSYQKSPPLPPVSPPSKVSYLPQSDSDKLPAYFQIHVPGLHTLSEAAENAPPRFDSSQQSPSPTAQATSSVLPSGPCLSPPQTDSVDLQMGQASPLKASSPGIVCVHCYQVKESNVPILEAIFKKYGDIAAESEYTLASMRSSFLDGICEIVRLVQTNDVIDKVEEVERYVSLAEQAKIDVSWLRAHLEAIQKTKEAAMEKSSLLVEIKNNIILVKGAALMDQKQRCAELLAAQERFVEADRCVRVLHFVERYLEDNLVTSEAEKGFLVTQPIL